MRSLNDIARLEKAIGQRWGKETVANPKSWWDTEKEKEYLEQLEELSKKQREVADKSEKVEVDGFLISKKLLNRETKLICPTCQNRIKTVNDDIYVNKYECCEKCYINFVEGREERWLSGWRPNREKDNVTENL